MIFTRTLRKSIKTNKKTITKKTNIKSVLFSTSSSIKSNDQQTKLNSLSTFSSDEQMLRETVSKFAKETIEPKVKQMDEDQKMDKEIIKKCFDQGLMGIETPADLGGSEMTFTSSIITIEELAKVDPSVSVMVDVQNTLINTPFMKWGSKQLKEKYLPKLANESLGSFCLSEYGSGSDAFALKTKAEKKGEDYVLNGSKAWITNGYEADIFVVFANLDPSKGYKGITAFVVERGFDGFKVGKKEDKLGIRASSTVELLFDNVVVPKENVLGEIGKGYKYAISILNEGRIGIGSQMLGLAQGAYEQTIPYLTQRKQFGNTISSFQGMQFDYARLYMEIEAARLMVYNAARLKEEGKDFVMQASMAKLYASEVAEKVASKCISMCGGVGFTKEFPQEKFFRDCKIGQIYEGTTNIQLQTIAKHVEKMYK